MEENARVCGNNVYRIRRELAWSRPVDWIDQMSHHAYIVGAFIGFVAAVALFAGLACGHVGPIVKSVQPACEELATRYGRPDLAAICRAAGDLAPVIDILVGEAKAGQCR